MKNVDVNEAKRLMQDYLKAHPGPNFASEIAEALGLELDITFETINNLLAEGRIKKAKNQDINPKNQVQQKNSINQFGLTILS